MNRPPSCPSARIHPSCASHPSNRVVRYHTSETIERGIAVTREVLRATCDLARARGAVPLIVVPQFAPETAAERDLRQRILDGSGLPVVQVELDGAWRIPGDGHPDARAARAMAAAVSERLAAGFARTSRGLKPPRYRHM